MKKRPPTEDDKLRNAAASGVTPNDQPWPREVQAEQPSGVEGAKDSKIAEAGITEQAKEGIVEVATEDAAPETAVPTSAELQLKPSLFARLRCHWKLLLPIAVILVLGSAGGGYWLVRSRQAVTAPVSRFAAVVAPFRIVGTVPAAGQKSVVDGSKIVLKFNRPVDAGKLSGDFFVSPTVQGTYQQGATANEAVFTPEVPFTQGTAVKVMVHGEFESQDGSKLGADYSFGFTTATPANGVIFERNGLIETLGSVPAGTKQTYTIFAGDAIKDGNTVTVYKGTAEQLLSSLTYIDRQTDNGYSYPAFGQQGIDTTALTAVTTKASLKDSDNFDFTPDKGVYVLVATNNGVQTGYTWLVASSFGVIVRQDDRQVVLAAQDFNSGEPVSTDVTMYNLHYGVQELAQATINGVGAVQLPFKPSLDVAVATYGDEVAVVPVSTYLTLADVRVQKDLSTSDTIYGLTDRPTYSVGDTVHYAGFVRTDNDAGYQVPDGGALHLYAAAYPSGPHYADTDVPILPGGVINASFQVGSEAISDGQGSQQLFVYNGSADNQTDADSPAGAFTVTNSKPSSWRLNVVFAKDSYLASDTITATVAGIQSDGTPLAGKTVEANIYTKDYYEDDTADNLNSFGNYGNKVTDQPLKLALDSSGRATVPIDVSKFPAGTSQLATVQASLTDPGGAVAAGGASAIVHEGNGVLEFKPSRTVIPPGGQVVGRIYAKALDDMPLKNAVVTYSLSTEQGDNSQKVANGTVTTDDHGYAEISQTVGEYPAGTAFILTASTADSSNNEISSTNYYYAQSDDNIAYSDVQLSNIDISGVPDSIQAGQTLNLTIDTPQAIHVLVTTERGRIHSFKTLDMKAGKNSYTLPVDADLAPSFSLVFSYFQGGSYHVEGATFGVSAQGKQAKLTLNLPTTMQAGHTADVTLKVAGADGKPLPSSVILGAVSANTFDLNSQVTPNIFDYLYSEREITTNASSSLTGIGSGGGKCGGGGFDQPALLNPLGQTASWQPDLATDALGNATIQLQLPKGDWRVYAYAMGDDSSVASSYSMVTAQ